MVQKSPAGGKARNFSVPLPTLTTPRLTAFAVVLYAVGFVVANVHYARYEVTPLDILQTRYLSGAILFGFATLIPFIGGFVLYSVIYEYGGLLRLAETKLLRRLRVVGPASLLVGILVGMFDLFLATVVIDQTKIHGVWDAFFLILLSGSALAWLLNDTRFGEATDLYPGVLCASLLLIWAFLFGTYAYPEIPRSFGGGAGWIGRIALTDSVAVQLFGRGGEREAIVVDRTNESTTFISCRDSSQHPLAFTVRSADVRWLIISAPKGLLSLSSMVCVHEKRKP